MTDADRYKVNLDELDAAITTLTAFGQRVEDWLAEVDRHIADLHLSWSGEAAVAQQAAHDKWSAGVREMRENLDELRQVAARAHANYSAVVATNTQMWP